MNSEEFKNAAQLLSRLGLTANYAGFYHTAYAVALAVQKPERLLFVTKWIYPDVAIQYATSAKCVERNIRTASDLTWQRNPELLREIAQYSLSKKPTNAEFLAILSAHISYINVSK